MGRRCLLDAKRIKRICEGVEAGLTYKMSAKYAGISESTFFSWLREGRKEEGEEKYKNFVSKLEQAEIGGAVFHLQNIKEHSKKDWKPSAWILERRHNFTRYNHIQSQQESQEATTDPKKLLEEAIKKNREASNKALAMGSLQAYAALQRQQISAVLQLKELNKEEHENGGDSTDAEIIGEISTMILSLPPIMRQRLESEITLRSSANVVSLMKK